MIALIIIGDILICGFLAGLVAWMFVINDDETIDEAARLPLSEEDK